MNDLSLTDGDITHRQKIVQLLRMAIDQKWEFSYIKRVRRRNSVKPLVLLSVDTEHANFRIRCDELDVDLAQSGAMMFRGISGGISVMFQTRLYQEPDNVVVKQPASVHEFDLPYKVVCTQLRKSVRVGLDSKSDVTATLFLNNGAMIEGTVLDLSATGVKIQVNKELVMESRNPQLIDGCKINLSEGIEVQSAIQVIGLTVEKEMKMSVVRCQFMNTPAGEEEKLDAFINEIVEQENAAVIDDD